MWTLTYVSWSLFYYTHNKLLDSWHPNYASYHSLLLIYQWDNYSTTFISSVHGHRCTTFFLIYKIPVYSSNFFSLKQWQSQFLPLSLFSVWLWGNLSQVCAGLGSCIIVCSHPSWFELVNDWINRCWIKEEL